MAGRRAVARPAGAPPTPAPQVPSAVVQSRLAVLPADWLPIALILGDAIIAAVSVPAGYWARYYHAPQVLPYGPYLAATPVVIAIYLFSLALTGQYRSWRGRTLIDQVFALLAGVGLAAVLIFAAIELGNLGQSYSRLTIVPAVIIA